MNPEQVQVERRAAQRFDFQLPVSVRLADQEREGHGFTQDVSARGIFFLTDFRLREGDAVELTMVMPSEITLTENMRVRCRGKVVRAVNLAVGNRAGIAVHIEGYEYLPEADPVTEVSASFNRIAALHERPRESEPAVSSHAFQARPAPY
jgi:hypothetical protein